jgi:hypothetical protein
MAPNFLSVICCQEVFLWLGIQGSECLIVVGALFPLDGGRRREGKKKEKRKEKRKKITVGKEGFPRAGPAFLSVQWVSVFRCN